MADENPIDLNNRVIEAGRVLTASFRVREETNSLYSSATEYLTQKALEEAYAKDATAKDISEQFSGLGKEIRKMRSSFLPIEFFQNTSGIFSSELSDRVAERESYENAFMRMLGMPESDDIAFAERLITVSPGGELNTEVPFEDVEVEVLDERQKVRNKRLVVIDGNLYNLETQEIEEIETEEQAIQFAIGPVEIGPLAEQESTPKIDNIDQDFYKFTFLLFPPIKDSRISKCINEPKKIVAPPFSNKRARIINNNNIKPTLLESVIRIRLDRLAGTESFKPTPEEEEGLISLELSFGNPKTEPPADTFGVLEALFILRLDSALRGLGKKMAMDIDKILEEFENTGLRVSDPESGSGGAGEEPPPDESASRIVPVDELIESSKDNISKLNNQKLIEDSLLALLGDRSEALDLQLQTQRNNSIRDAHLMSGLLGVMDVPRKKINEELRSIKKAQLQRAEQSSDLKRAVINRSLGVDIGVGNIDILAFSLALFTMSEGGLLGLLSDSAFDRLSEDPAFSSFTLPDRKDILTSVNELTELAYSAYEVFRTSLEGREEDE
jgi:hypothetical protein